MRPDSTSNTAQLLWYETQPRAVATGVTDSLRINAAVRGTPATVQIQLRTGVFVPLQRASNGLYTARLAVSDVLFGYRTADLHNVAGFLEVTAGNLTQQTTLIVNVRDALVPATEVTVLSQTAQMSPHVFNLRYDSLYLGTQAPAQVLQAFYQVLDDEYDFINVIEQVVSANDIFYFAARNDITGLGLQTFDRAAGYGSAARLQGILHFPNDALFDPAWTANLHELSHRWMNFSNLPSLRAGRPHWPISSLAYGINGFSHPLTGDPLIFRYSITPQPNGTFTLARITDPIFYNDFELYLLGLLPADSVAPHLVFLNQDQHSEVRPGGTLRGAVDTVTAAEWIARDGARNPAYSAAQREFRMATIVLSRNGLLSREEMAFFNHMAARGELRSDVQVLNGTTRLTTAPFYIATGGRGTLVTRLRSTQRN